MDIWTMLRTSLRRWYVSLPILAVSLGLGYTMAQDLDPVYSAESSAILIAPEIVPGVAEGELVEVNPYLNLGGGLTTTTQVLVVLMDSGPNRLKYFDLGLEPDFEVSRSDAVMYFTVTGADADAVTHTANELVSIADAEVAALQDKDAIDPARRIQVRPLSLPQVAVEHGGAGIQLMAILGVLGLVAAVAGALALDGFLRWRADRAARQHASGAGPEDSARPKERRARLSRLRAHRRPAHQTRPGSGTPGDGPETPAGDSASSDAAGSVTSARR